MLPSKNRLCSLFEQKIISFLDKNPKIKITFFKLYYKFFPENQLSYWFLKLDERIPINVVQIGSNDGITGDPLFNIALKRKNWNLLLVEPIPYLFEKLKKNYPKESRFRFENVAINDGSRQKFYFIREGALKNESVNPEWYKQIGSFQKQHLKKHFDIDIEKYIEDIEIKGISLDQLFERNHIEKLDFLHIDAEGYDWKILSQMDLEKYKPQLILFEQKHLKENEITEALAYLEDYKILKFTSDYLCISKSMLTRKDSIKLKRRAVN